jgi:hypothetical protein
MHVLDWREDDIILNLPLDITFATRKNCRCWTKELDLVEKHDPNKIMQNPLEKGLREQELMTLGCVWYHRQCLLV